MYEKTNWLDQNVERPKTYEIIKNNDGSCTLLDSFGEVTELGTPVNAENMNHIEEGISILDISKMENNLSNITNSGKELISKYGLPNYSKGKNLVSDTIYMAEYPQFILINAWYSGGGQSGYIRSSIKIYDGDNELPWYFHDQTPLPSNDGSNFCSSVSAFIDAGINYSCYLEICGGYKNAHTYILSFPLIGVVTEDTKGDN